MKVEREIIVPAEPSEVWEALTDPERLEEWFANDVELDPEPGGEGVFRWDDGEERRAVVEEADGARRLAFRWSVEDGEETLVVFALDEVEGGTRLVVTEEPVGPRACAGEWSLAVELSLVAGGHAALV